LEKRETAESILAEAKRRDSARPIAPRSQAASRWRTRAVGMKTVF
jgi:hypothetical protein